VFRRDVETQPPEERARLQAERLRALLGRLHAVDSEYWREKLRGVVPETPLAELPFTTKDELRETFPYGMLAVPLERTVRVHASSGTHGKPTIVAYTAADVELFAEVNARSIACAGGSAGDVLHVAYGYGLFTGGLGLHYGGERLGATVVPASGGNVPLQLELLADLRAAGLACTPSFCLLLAERARASGFAERIRLRYGVLGAEPWSEAMRGKIEEAWGGSFDACDIYGLSEVIGPGVAAECREGKGALHVFDDVFLPEIVDPETGEPAAAGELVLTTLTKEALPVLRYRSGDVTRWIDGGCPCGRTHRRIARRPGARRPVRDRRRPPRDAAEPRGALRARRAARGARGPAARARGAARAAPAPPRRPAPRRSRRAAASGGREGEARVRAPRRRRAVLMDRQRPVDDRP
jgi:phenylacetate-CoA ligase